MKRFYIGLGDIGFLLAEKISEENHIAIDAGSVRANKKNI